MENKLELKHLASYLPYGVKVIHEDEIKEIHGIINDEIYLSYNDIGTDNNYCFAEDIILILRPLSQLTTEIEHNGEKFVPINVIRKFGLGHVDFITTEREGWIEDYGNEGWISRLPYGILEFLLSLHFDIYGLIDKNLAIELK
jgi:hypothetical protein